MPVQLRIRDDLTMDAVVALAVDHLVKVTPHVGNWTPARLVLPTLGVSILCVDHTIGLKDKNAHPHLLIQDGEAHVISSHADRLTTHARVTERAGCFSHPLGASLSDVHVGAVRELYPEASIETHSEHLRANREITLSVLEEATKESVSASWWRRVDRRGAITCFRSRDLPRTWGEYEPHIFTLTDEREGWLIHNRIAILMDVILQSRMGTEPEIYHLSGPDMVRYLGGEIEVISRMYDRMRSRFGMREGEIIFNLVPFASFRFASRLSQANACEKLSEELMNGTPEMRTIRDHAREAFDVLAESETRSYFTQHDCLATGERIIVPSVARGWTMAECAERFAHMQRAIA